MDAGDFSLASTGGIAGAGVVEVIGSGGAYSVTAATGSGDGTIRLDLIDNDSIVDQVNNPLGGSGAGNGSFTIGDVYTINENPPVVTSIVRSDADPTSVDPVHFTVVFSEFVNGVDAGDFALTTSGTLTNAAILSINGSGNTYIATIGTGSGNGTIRLTCSITTPSWTHLDSPWEAAERATAISPLEIGTVKLRWASRMNTALVLFSK